MEPDIEWLGPVFSPYLAVLDVNRVSYVSPALGRMLGSGGDAAVKAVEEALSQGACGPEGALPDAVTLPPQTGARFLCVPLTIDGHTVVAFREEPSRDAAVMEILDRDAFVRMFMNSPAGGVIVDRGLVVFANGFFCRMLGMEYRSLVGKPLVRIVARQSLQELACACKSWFSHEVFSPDPADISFVDASGRLVPCSVTGGAFDRGGRPLVWMAVQDVSALRRLERELAEQRRMYQELFDKLTVGVLYINPRGRIVDCNETVCAVVGYPKEKIRGSVFTAYVGTQEADVLRKDFRELFEGGVEISRRETTIRTQDGRDITIEYDARPAYLRKRIYMAIMVFTDVTEKKALERELLEKNAEMERTLWDMAEVKDALEARAGELNRATEELKLLNERLSMLSITDGLTEVYNHRHFQDRLGEEVERLNRMKDAWLSLLMIDIDDFKRFNDTYGHQCGDMVLKHIAFLIKNAVRSIDIVARYGGEEFAVILPGATRGQARIVAERVCQVIRNTPFDLGGSRKAHVTVSIGVGTIPSGFKDKSQLVRMADSALYAAKARWKDRVEVWEEEL